VALWHLGSGGEVNGLSVARDKKTVSSTEALKGLPVKVVNLKIANFRSIKSAELRFDGHCLIVGPNNVGKSTVCEALDLVLGPDRISRFPPVEEFDFHNARYFVPSEVEGEVPTAVPIRIEVILTDINAEVENRCGQHLEFWNTAEKRLLAALKVQVQHLL